MKLKRPTLRELIKYHWWMFWYSWDYYLSGFEGKVRYLQREYKEKKCWKNSKNKFRRL